MKKLTQELALKKLIYVHKDKYDYKLFIFNKTSSKVNIICKIHGIFEQRYSDHANGSGCPKCSGLNKKNTKEFVFESNKKHNNKYLYNKTFYKNSQTKLIITCKKHGDFNQTPNSHLSGKGCPKCGLESQKEKQSLGTKVFINRANIIHNNIYDYSNVVYKNKKTKVKIKCKYHIFFYQTPKEHLSGSGCIKCSKIRKGKIKTLKDFVNLSNEVHKNKYLYNKTNYTFITNTEVIICPIHGEFKQRLISHLNGHGCRKCNSSKGELKIIDFLFKHKINFEYQKAFKDCKRIKLLFFDFYISDKKICIEYNGKQHYFSNDYFGGDCEFVKIQERDKIKEEYCLKNNLKLFSISYLDDINLKLSEILL